MAFFNVKTQWQRFRRFTVHNDNNQKHFELQQTTKISMTPFSPNFCYLSRALFHSCWHFCASAQLSILSTICSTPTYIPGQTQYHRNKMIVLPVIGVICLVSGVYRSRKFEILLPGSWPESISYEKNRNLAGLKRAESRRPKNAAWDRERRQSKHLRKGLFLAVQTSLPRLASSTPKEPQ